ncbi:MAG: lysostaphin resistance A-like protein [Caldilineaceae bacterium]
MQDIAGIVLAFLPIIAILFFANLGQGQRERGEPAGFFTTLAYALLIIVYGTGILIGFTAHLMGFIVEREPALVASLASGVGESLFDNLHLLAVGLWLPSLVGILLLTKPIRVAVSHIIPIDPESPVDAVALSFTMLIVINLMTTLGVGLENLAKMLAEDGGADTGGTIGSLWAQQLVMAITAAIGVGWLTRRNFASSLRRLGIVPPTGPQMLIGLAAGVAMVFVVGILGYLAMRMGLQANQDVENLTEQLLGSLFESPWGIVTLGLAAALGEEPLFRGAAQPKFGLILTALLFALVHSQYGISLSTGIVFLLGIVLGVIRMRGNTSMSMITHATYNITLGLLAFYSIPFMEP